MIHSFSPLPQQKNIGGQYKERETAGKSPANTFFVWIDDLRAAGLVMFSAGGDHAGDH